MHSILQRIKSQSIISPGLLYPYLCFDININVDIDIDLNLNLNLIPLKLKMRESLGFVR
jgi:hypothetical protein